ncbi:hypothetical protein MHBO_001564 [Bonamia ostreae]|uniref:Uncharacterized protein n=1 Tax=Bonamia ostreae TaxID=126728 RepID=A0ABV2AJG1_9EUKA
MADARSDSESHIYTKPHRYESDDDEEYSRNGRRPKNRESFSRQQNYNRNKQNRSSRQRPYRKKDQFNDHFSANRRPKNYKDGRNTENDFRNDDFENGQFDQTELSKKNFFTGETKWRKERNWRSPSRDVRRSDRNAPNLSPQEIQSLVLDEHEKFNRAYNRLLKDHHDAVQKLLKIRNGQNSKNFADYSSPRSFRNNYDDYEEKKYPRESQRNFARNAETRYQEKISRGLRFPSKIDYDKDFKLNVNAREFVPSNKKDEQDQNYGQNKRNFNRRRNLDNRRRNDSKPKPSWADNELSNREASAEENNFENEYTWAPQEKKVEENVSSESEVNLNEITALDGLSSEGGNIDWDDDIKDDKNKNDDKNKKVDFDEDDQKVDGDNQKVGIGGDDQNDDKNKKVDFDEDDQKDDGDNKKDK